MPGCSIRGIWIINNFDNVIFSRRFPVVEKQWRVACKKEEHKSEEKLISSLSCPLPTDAEIARAFIDRKQRCYNWAKKVRSKTWNHHKPRYPMWSMVIVHHNRPWYEGVHGVGCVFGGLEGVSGTSHVKSPEEWVQTREEIKVGDGESFASEAILELREVADPGTELKGVEAHKPLRMCWSWYFWEFGIWEVGARRFRASWSPSSPLVVLNYKMSNIVAQGLRRQARWQYLKGERHWGALMELTNQTVKHRALALRIGSTYKFERTKEEKGWRSMEDRGKIVGENQKKKKEKDKEAKERAKRHRGRRNQGAGSRQGGQAWSKEEGEKGTRKGTKKIGAQRGVHLQGSKVSRVSADSNRRGSIQSSSGREEGKGRRRFGAQSKKCACMALSIGVDLKGLKRRPIEKEHSGGVTWCFLQLTPGGYIRKELKSRVLVRNTYNVSLAFVCREANTVTPTCCLTGVERSSGEKISNAKCTE
eukprot:Gb_05098 [translate_table: standard]